MVMLGRGVKPRRLGLVVLLVLAAGCTEEESESFGDGLGSLLLFFLLLAVLVIVILGVLLVLGVSFLGSGVARMTRRSTPPAGPWWDAEAQVWRAPDGSVFDAALQRWIPPPPGTAPPSAGQVAESDRTSGAVLIGIGGTVITFVAAALIDGPAEALVVVAGLGLTAALIHQLWTRGDPAPPSEGSTEPPPAAAPASSPPTLPPRRRRPLQAELAPEDPPDDQT